MFVNPLNRVGAVTLDEGRGLSTMLPNNVKHVVFPHCFVGDEKIKSGEIQAASWQ